MPIVPSIAFQPSATGASSGAILIFSGRTPIWIRPAFVPTRSAGTRRTAPWASRTVASPPPAATTWQESRFDAPRNPATNSVAGRSYTSSGRPTCSIRPATITASRSDMTIASSWSWVT